ncbi:hypothetical protein HC928_13220, partial [bacterium]|nr:hypothetical protein [bacterium]
MNYFRHTPYGSPFGATSPTPPTPFAFTGQPRDLHGLQYHRARYYDPELGVWLSADPLELGLNHLRADINRFFYASSLTTFQNSAAAHPLASLSNNLAPDSQPMLPPCDNFGW